MEEEVVQEQQHWFYLGSKQASDHETLHDFTINCIQAEHKCKDIVRALEIWIKKTQKIGHLIGKFVTRQKDQKSASSKS